MSPGLCFNENTNSQGNGEHGALTYNIWVAGGGNRNPTGKEPDMICGPLCNLSVRWCVHPRRGRVLALRVRACQSDGSRFC